GIEDAAAATDGASDEPSGLTVADDVIGKSQVAAIKNIAALVAQKIDGGRGIAGGDSQAGDGYRRIIGGDVEDAETRTAERDVAAADSQLRGTQSRDGHIIGDLQLALGERDGLAGQTTAESDGAVVIGWDVRLVDAITDVAGRARTDACISETGDRVGRQQGSIFQRFQLETCARRLASHADRLRGAQKQPASQPTKPQGAYHWRVSI